MKPPCKHCPFRRRFMGEHDYLRPGRRAEIALSILEGAEFPCHETVEHGEDEDGFSIEYTGGSTPCVGLDLVQLRAGRAGQMLRIRERIGYTNTVELLRRGRKIELWTWDEVLGDGYDDEEEGETCALSCYGCEAPAGYMVGGEVVNGTEFLYEDDICPTCGEHICPSCMFHTDHECVQPREPMRRSPRPTRKDLATYGYDREAIGIPPQAQRSRSRRDRPGLPPDGAPLGTDA